MNTFCWILVTITFIQLSTEYKGKQCFKPFKSCKCPRSGIINEDDLKDYLIEYAVKRRNHRLIHPCCCTRWNWFGIGKPWIYGCDSGNECAGKYGILKWVDSDCWRDCYYRAEEHVEDYNQEFIVNPTCQTEFHGFFVNDGVYYRGCKVVSMEEAICSLEFYMKKPSHEVQCILKKDMPRVIFMDIFGKITLNTKHMTQFPDTITCVFTPFTFWDKFEFYYVLIVMQKCKENNFEKIKQCDIRKSRRSQRTCTANILNCKHSLLVLTKCVAIPIQQPFKRSSKYAWKGGMKRMVDNIEIWLRAQISFEILYEKIHVEDGDIFSYGQALKCTSNGTQWILSYHIQQICNGDVLQTIVCSDSPQCEMSITSRKPLEDCLMVCSGVVRPEFVQHQKLGQIKLVFDNHTVIVAGEVFPKISIQNVRIDQPISKFGVANFKTLIDCTHEPDVAGFTLNLKSDDGGSSNTVTTGIKLFDKNSMSIAELLGPRKRSNNVFSKVITSQIMVSCSSRFRRFTKNHEVRAVVFILDTVPILLNSIMTQQNGASSPPKYALAACSEKSSDTGLVIHPYWFIDLEWPYLVSYVTVGLKDANLFKKAFLIVNQFMDSSIITAISANSRDICATFCTYGSADCNPSVQLDLTFLCYKEGRYVGLVLNLRRGGRLQLCDLKIYQDHRPDIKMIQKSGSEISFDRRQTHVLCQKDCEDFICRLDINRRIPLKVKVREHYLPLDTWKSVKKNKKTYEYRIVKLSTDQIGLYCKFYISEFEHETLEVQIMVVTWNSDDKVYLFSKQLGKLKTGLTHYINEEEDHITCVYECSSKSGIRTSKCSSFRIQIESHTNPVLNDLIERKLEMWTSPKSPSIAIPNFYMKPKSVAPTQYIKCQIFMDSPKIQIASETEVTIIRKINPRPQIIQTRYWTLRSDFAYCRTQGFPNKKISFLINGKPFKSQINSVINFNKITAIVPRLVQLKCTVQTSFLKNVTKRTASSYFRVINSIASITLIAPKLVHLFPYLKIGLYCQVKASHFTDITFRWAFFDIVRRNYRSLTINTPYLFLFDFITQHGFYSFQCTASTSSSEIVTAQSGVIEILKCDKMAPSMIYDKLTLTKNDSELYGSWNKTVQCQFPYSGEVKYVFEYKSGGIWSPVNHDYVKDNVMSLAMLKNISSLELKCEIQILNVARKCPGGAPPLITIKVKTFVASVISIDPKKPQYTTEDSVTCTHQNGQPPVKYYKWLITGGPFNFKQKEHYDTKVLSLKRVIIPSFHAYKFECKAFVEVNLVKFEIGSANEMINYLPIDLYFYPIKQYYDLHDEIECKTVNVKNGILLITAHPPSAIKIFGSEFKIISDANDEIVVTCSDIASKKSLTQTLHLKSNYKVTILPKEERRTGFPHGFTFECSIEGYPPGIVFWTITGVADPWNYFMANENRLTIVQGYPLPKNTDLTIACWLVDKQKQIHQDIKQIFVNHHLSCKDTDPATQLEVIIVSSKNKVFCAFDSCAKPSSISLKIRNVLYANDSLTIENPGVFNLNKMKGGEYKIQCVAYITGSINKTVEIFSLVKEHTVFKRMSYVKFDHEFDEIDEPTVFKCIADGYPRPEIEIVINEGQHDYIQVSPPFVSLSVPEKPQNYSITCYATQHKEKHMLEIRKEFRLIKLEYWLDTPWIGVINCLFCFALSMFVYLPTYRYVCLGEDYRIDRQGNRILNDDIYGSSGSSEWDSNSENETSGKSSDTDESLLDGRRGPQEKSSRKFYKNMP